MQDISIMGTRLTLSQVRARWGAADIFTFVSEELRVLEESEVLKRGSLGRSFQVRRDQGVQQVESGGKYDKKPQFQKNKEDKEYSHQSKGGKDGKGEKDGGQGRRDSPKDGQKGKGKGKGHDGKGHGRGGGKSA